MPIKIQEVDQNLTHVIWDTTVCHSKGELHETFIVFNRLSLPRLFHLGVSCNFELKKEFLNPSNTQEPLQFNISLCLAGARRWLKDESNSSIVHPLPLQNGLSAVWANVNGSRKNLLQGMGTFKNPNWSTKNPLTVKLQRSNLPLLQFRKSKKRDFSFELKCEFWIEFDLLIDSQRKTLQHLTEFYENQIRCDVQFYFENGDHIGGHVNILAARSSVFSAMFQHQMAETKTGQVDIFDIQPEIFKQLLHFIYSGRIGIPLNEDNAKSLYEVADKYCIEDLKEKCVDFLRHCVDFNNAIQVVVWADLHSVESIKEIAIKKIVDHGEVICETEAWEELMKKYTDLCLFVTRRMMKKNRI